MTKRRTAVTVQATLSAIKSAKPAGGYYSSDGNAIDLVFNVKLGKAEPLKSFKDWCLNKYNATDYERDLRQKPPKAKKGEETPPPLTEEQIAAAVLEKFGPKYEEQCRQTVEKNQRVMGNAVGQAIFFALVGSAVNLTVSLAQQGFEEMLAPTALLMAPTSQIIDNEGAEEAAQDEGD